MGIKAHTGSESAASGLKSEGGAVQEGGSFLWSGVFPIAIFCDF